MQRFAEYFAKREYEIYIISHEPFEFNDSNIHVYVVRYMDNVPFVHLFGKLLKLIKSRIIIRRMHPDIIHSHDVKNSVIGLFSGCHPWVVDIWGASGISVAAEVSLIWKLMVKSILKHADFVRVDDIATKERIIELGGFKDKTFIVDWGINTNDFSPDKRSQPLRDELGLRSSLTGICVSSLEKTYDIETLIKALPIILKKFSNTKFIIVGDGPEKQNLLYLAESLNVLNDVKFVGQLSYNSLPKYLASSDFYIDPLNKPLPSRTWYGKRVNCSMAGIGYSVAQMAAMSCGLPSIISNRPGTSEKLPEKYHKYLFEPGNSVDLANKVISLLENDNKRREYGIDSIKIAKYEFDWNKNMSKIEKIYQEATKSKVIVANE